MTDAYGGKKKTIGVVGACGRAGATYIASSLALSMARMTEGVSFLETNLCGCRKCSGKPLIFYEMNLHNGIFPGRFSDFFFMKFMGTETRNRVNLYKGVNWAVKREDSPLCLLLPEDIAGRYVIWDDPPLFDEADGFMHRGGKASDFCGEIKVRKDVMDKLDLILCVAGTETAYVAAGSETVKKCFAEGASKTKLIYNMISSKASLKAAEKYTGRKGDFLIWKCLPEKEKSIEVITNYLLTLY